MSEQTPPPASGPAPDPAPAPAPAAPSPGSAAFLAIVVVVVALMGVFIVGLVLLVQTRKPAEDADLAARLPADIDAAAFSRGRGLFATNCAACHGVGGVGVRGLGQNLLESGFIADRTDEELVAFLKVGRSADDPLNTVRVAMPAKGGNLSLTDAHLADLVVYMRGLQATRKR
jgi:mono/diheme cytochrome c family protein